MAADRLGALARKFGEAQEGKLLAGDGTSGCQLPSLAGRPAQTQRAPVHQAVRWAGALTTSCAP